MSDPTPPADKPETPEEEKGRIAATGEELPPLPDGGLAGTMPAWLQQAPSRPTRMRPPETVDLSSVTEGVEVPEWLTELSRRVEAGRAVEQQPEVERPLAEAIVKDAPEVGEPEAALDEPALAEKAEAQSPDTESESTPEAPEPVLRFQVRNVARAIPEPGNGVPDSGSTSSSHEPRYQMRAPAPQPQRSVGATILLVLLLIALAAIGVWYYMM